MVRTRPAKYERVRVTNLNDKHGLGLLGYMALILILPTFLLVLAFVRLNSDQVKLKRQLSEMRRDFGLRSKEMANLGLEVEMFRNGSRIFAQVQRLGLGLQMPQRGQVIRVRGGVPAPAPRPQRDDVLAER